ncbi:MAG: GMC family oxidoreductase [Gammaproteobacteria bacterium]|nr:MAG: GMC family oxidoreductase [Gammaproteobacteria bacterium]
MSAAERFALDDASVVVIVGSGAGGGTLGNELAQKGIKVVCLEAGTRLTLGDIHNDPAAMSAKLTWLDPRVGSGDLDPKVPARICKTVGGTTVHWAGAALRFQPHEWRKLGYREVHTGNMAINSQPYDGRPACLQIGFCMSGCAIGAKWSTLYTEVPRAEATGNFELRPECHAMRIEHDAAGRANAVVYVDAQGVNQRQRARIVCVAGNAIETPRLLLLSSSETFRDGLANSSGQVGRNYMMHTTGAAFAVMPGEVHPDRGTQMAGIVMDEARHRTDREFVGGFLLESFPPQGPLGFARRAKPGAWGRQYARDIEGYRNVAGLWIVGEDLPQTVNSVTLDPKVRDQHGLPVAHVHHVDHPNDATMRKRAWEVARSIYEAAGAGTIHTRGPFPATHNMGTCRQSASSRDGVCNKYGQTHDVRNLFIADGSQFVNSTSENPTLTIVALAIRQADYISKKMVRREL